MYQFQIPHLPIAIFTAMLPSLQVEAFIVLILRQPQLPMPGFIIVPYRATVAVVALILQPQALSQQKCTTVFFMATKQMPV